MGGGWNGIYFGVQFKTITMAPPPTPQPMPMPTPLPTPAPAPRPTPVPTPTTPQPTTQPTPQPTPVPRPKGVAWSTNLHKNCYPNDKGATDVPNIHHNDRNQRRRASSSAEGR